MINDIENQNLLTARVQAKHYLELYIKDKDEKNLIKAFKLDNTNSNILYYYIKNKKERNEKYKEVLENYKFLLNQNDSNSLNEVNINHKKDVIEILKSIMNISKNDLLNIQTLKESLNKYYPKEYKIILESRGKRRINNLPLDFVMI